MNFLNPEFLYYMLPPLFVLFGFLLTQKEAQLTFFSNEVIAKLRVSQNTLTIKARNALFFLVAILLIIALSGPVISDGEVEVKAKSADIMIALDISDSMLAQDVYPNRLKLAKQKSIELLKMAPNERIGVIAFAKNSYLVSPLSFDHGAVSFLLSQLNTDSITEKGTDFMAMLDVVANSVQNESKKYLLVLSDGGDENDFTQEIAYAKEKGIVLFVLGIGTSKGAPVKLKNGEFIKQNGNILISKLNENISDLATQSGGVYIESLNSNEDIKTMLKEIEANSSEKELKSETIHKFIPLFYYPLGLALVILLIATSSMSKREAVHLPSLLLFVVFVLYPKSLEASMLDFMELDKAKEAYKSGKYEESQALYEKYIGSKKSSDAYYNLGSSLYKQGKYKEAIESYQKASMHDNESSAKKYANIGNAYVKQKSPEMLQKAVESYESSLKLFEDKEVRENLEAVKKAIKEQEQKNQDKKDNQENQNSEEQNKESNENEENKENSQENNSSKQDSQNDSQDENSQESKQDTKEKEQQQKEKQEENQDKNESDANTSKNQAPKPELEELEQNDKNSSSQQGTQQESQMQEGMSEAEAQKWLQELNSQQNTYMYMLNKSNKIEENENAKPW